MVERVNWMSPIHYEILSFFETHDIIINPSSLAENIGYDTAQYVSTACGELAEAGILEVAATGPKFALTDTGRDFIRGKVDPDDLTEPGSDN